MLPDIRIIGDKTKIKKTTNKPKEIIKEEEAINNENNPGSYIGNEADDSEAIVFYDYVKRKIQENKKYPYRAKIENMEGTVEVQFSIVKNGTLKDVKIVNGSGYNVLDEEALSTIKRAAPYPCIPERLNAECLQLKLKMVYKME